MLVIVQASGKHGGKYPRIEKLERGLHCESVRSVEGTCPQSSSEWPYNQRSVSPSWCWALLGTCDRIL